MLESYFKKEEFSDLCRTDNGKLDNFAKYAKGNATIGLLAVLVATPICAYADSYIGQGIGWVGRNIVDFIPLVNKIAPWVAERSGLINPAYAANLNEDLYQTTGAIAGFWAGLFLPLQASFILGD